MASGVTFDEDYLDQRSDINRMGRVLALGGSMDDFASGLTETFAPAGSEWKYVSIDTHVLSMVVRGATGAQSQNCSAKRSSHQWGLSVRPII